MNLANLRHPKRHDEVAWHFDPLYSDGIAYRPDRAGNGFAYRLPVGVGNHVNYLETDDEHIAYRRFPKNGTLIFTGFITMAEGVNVYNADPHDVGGLPPNFRPMLFDGMGGGNSRWWPRQFVEVKPGAFSLEIPLSSDNWTNVFGKLASSRKARRKSYRDCLVTPVQLAITHGAGKHYGHGHFADGEVIVRVDSYRFD